MKQKGWHARLFHPDGGVFVVLRLSVVKQIVVSTSLTTQLRAHCGPFSFMGDLYLRTAICDPRWYLQLDWKTSDYTFFLPCTCECEGQCNEIGLYGVWKPAPITFPSHTSTQKEGALLGGNTPHSQSYAHAKTQPREQYPLIDVMFPNLRYFIWLVVLTYR